MFKKLLTVALLFLYFCANCMDEYSMQIGAKTKLSDGKHNNMLGTRFVSIEVADGRISQIGLVERCTKETVYEHFVYRIRGISVAHNQKVVEFFPDQMLFTLKSNGLIISVKYLYSDGKYLVLTNYRKNTFED